MKPTCTTILLLLIGTVIFLSPIFLSRDRHHPDGPFPSTLTTDSEASRTSRTESSVMSVHTPSGSTVRTLDVPAKELKPVAGHLKRAAAADTTDYTTAGAPRTVAGLRTEPRASTEGLPSHRATNFNTRTRPSLTIRFNGTQPLECPIRLAIFQRPDGFPNHTSALRVMSVEVTKSPAVARIDHLTPGRYAVAAYFDKNEDGVLNKAAFGAPTEPYGFSNNARGRFGPPSFKAASFEIVDGNHEMEITLK